MHPVKYSTMVQLNTGSPESQKNIVRIHPSRYIDGHGKWVTGSGDMTGIATQVGSPEAGGSSEIFFSRLDKDNNLVETVRIPVVDDNKPAINGIASDNPILKKTLDSGVLNKHNVQSNYSNAQATQKFTVNGVDYNIPSDKVDAFKKAKGIK